jgi:small subunit ribosomal protein S13
MLQIFDKKLPDKKQVKHSLTYIFGINLRNAAYICKKTGINPSISMGSLKKNQINLLMGYITKYVEIEQDLKNFKKDRLYTLRSIKSYRGLRNWNGLPVRGQRTHTNSKTKKKFMYRKY